MFKLTVIAIALFITTAINFVVSYISWRRRNTKGGMYFSLGMMCTTLWSLATALDYAAVPLSLKIFFATIEAWGYCSAIALFAVFSILFAGYDSWLEKKWIKTLLLFIPASNILLISTNKFHGWVWKGFIQTSNNILVFEHGPGFLWILSTSYLLTLTIIISLWQASRKGSEISRRQGRLLLYAILFPVAANLIYNFGIGGMAGIDWTSITFSVTGGLFLRALYGQRLLDIVPIARDKLINSLSDGMIVLDTQNRIIDINHSAAQMVSTLPESLLGKDIMDVIPLTRAFLEQPFNHDIKTEIEIGSMDKRYYDVLLSPLREGPQKMIGRLIISRDITERKKNELRLLQLTQAVEQSPASVVITNLQGKIDYVNPRFSTLTGYSLSELVGKNPNIIQSGHTPVETYQEMWQTIQSGKTWRGELLNRKKNGDLYWELEVVAPVFDNLGNIINFIAVKEDITRQKEAEVKLQNANNQLEEKIKEVQGLQLILQEQATRDSLTGLHNRRYLKETLVREFARAKREEYPICFILIDIDHFKAINDTYGHSMGDVYIQHLAGQLLTFTRIGDIICRYGGEEFLVVLPNTTIEVAFKIGERLRTAFQESSIQENGMETKATISLGISKFPTDGSTEMEVLNSADKALYAAKHSGRNQVAIWSRIK